MATCGHCKETGQTVEHVRTCGTSTVTTKELPVLVGGNVVTLTNADDYWVVCYAKADEQSVYKADQLLPGGQHGAWAYIHASEVELFFATATDAQDYRHAAAVAARLAKTSETLHGDANYCRGCAEGWAGAKWHRAGCSAVTEDQLRNAAPQPAEQSDAWGPVNELRNAIKSHLHRKIRNAQVGHFAVRVDGSDVVKFYRAKLITEGRWVGKVFVDAQASDDFYPVKTPATLTDVLTAILADPHAAEELYGQELGQCYRCNRTLTDETSRALGIGPECRSKL